MEDSINATNWLVFEHKHIATVSGRFLKAASEIVGKGGSRRAQRMVREAPSLLEILLELHLRQEDEFFAPLEAIVSSNLDPSEIMGLEAMDQKLEEADHPPDEAERVANYLKVAYLLGGHLDEHDEVRSALKDVTRLAGRPAGDGISWTMRVYQAASRLHNILLQHCEREDNVLFPLWESLLDERTKTRVMIRMDTLRNEFEKQEKAL